ncbi:hypothetical protein EV2_025409 [Malus domestica]
MEAKGRIRRGNRIWQIAFGSGFKCNSAIWEALRNVKPSRNGPWENCIDTYPVKVVSKLKTKHSGHFGSTSGDKGKFGLTTTQILRVVKKLDKLGMLDYFQLLHFHIGSQIPSTALLADGVSEASQIYCELVRLDAHMKVIDIGGGLGIDYDGSKSSDSEISVSYGLEEYASAVVRTVRNVCERRSVKHPVICSESGRTLVSHLRHHAPCPASSSTPTRLCSGS